MILRSGAWSVAVSNSGIAMSSGEP
jgi:hypothetical protein